MALKMTKKKKGSFCGLLIKNTNAHIVWGGALAAEEKKWDKTMKETKDRIIIEFKLNYIERHIKF